MLAVCCTYPALSSPRSADANGTKMGAAASAPSGMSTPASASALEKWSTDDVIAALQSLGCSKYAAAVADQNIDGCALKSELERLQQRYDTAQAARKREQKLRAIAARKNRPEISNTSSSFASDGQRKAQRARQGSCTTIESFDDLSSSQTDWAQPCQVSPPRISSQRGARRDH